MLSLSDRVEVDVNRIREHARTLGQPGTVAGAASLLGELRDAPLLPGRVLEDWAAFEQSRLQQDRLQIFTDIAARSLTLGDDGTAGAAAEAAVGIEPLYENAVGLLIRAELQRGNPGAALRAYERYRQQLQEDMGLLPAEPVRELLAPVLERRERVAKERLVPAGDPWRRRASA